MRLTLSTKIMLLLQVALCFALASTAVLSYLKMERMVEETVASRFRVVAHGLSGEVEGAVNLGVALNALRNLDEMIQRALVRDLQITGLMLFNDRGEVLGAAGSNAVRGTLPDSWLAAFRRDGQTDRGAKIVDGGSQVLLIGIGNAYGGVAGGVALTYSLDTVRAGIRGTIPELATFGAINLATCYVISMIVVWLVMRRLQRCLRDAAIIVEAAAEGECPVVPPEIAAFAPGLAGFLDRVSTRSGQGTGERKSAPVEVA
ncbi:hypothetical protein AZL_a01530 (plasmid) [Azospirillum sp. B510]|uniref:hypothetical protein n=1 Tax=Azospirillum sp. (strain B510) TaxID=137722 RepID=UPI0001C4B8E4|nr:hypothetical protein [Azospirillum sp. B510]BAI73684.1 hypothetical protein AZL_a01530 [Azospirillum sp. B510]